MSGERAKSTDPRTIQSYDAIAGVYLERWPHRQFLLGDLGQFIALLTGNRRVLDLGCGPGFDAAALLEAGTRAFGLDLSWGMLQVGREQFSVPLIQGDMCRLPLAAETMDGIWASASLLHLPRGSTDAALSEIRRVLAPGGVLYLSVKAGRGSKWQQVSYDRDAPRRYTYWQPDELDRRLRLAGFTIVHQGVNELTDVTWLVRLATKTPT